MLYIFGGLPGAGKTTLARRLAADLKAVYLRIDTIEHAITAYGLPITGPEGYTVAYRVAADNLLNGLDVVADSVNPLAITRQSWRSAATESGAPFREIEVICSDPAEHRRRVETRPADIDGLRLPMWDEVVNREYHPWDTAPIVVDTAGKTPEESVAELVAAIRG